jgi:uncharacterized membrane-anchored protein YhcB (DUF1043 family)
VTSNWYYFLSGMIPGFFLGMAVICFCVAAKRADADAEKEALARAVKEWHEYRAEVGK